MATEDFSGSLFVENESMVDIQVMDYSNFTLKDETEDTYEDSTDGLIVSDGEQSDDFQIEDMAPHLVTNALTLVTLPDGTQAFVGAHDITQKTEDTYEDSTDGLIVSDGDQTDDFQIEDMAPHLVTNGLTLVTLPDGTQAFVGAHDITQSMELDLEDTPLVCNEDGTRHIQLDDGTVATLHLSPKDDNEHYQPVAMEDGSTTYITLSDLARTLNASEAAKDVQQPEAEEPPDDAAASPEPDSQPQATSTLIVHKEKPASKSHQCPVVNCGKLYSTSHHLKVHQRAHTGDRPFQCPEEGCNKAFSTGYGCKAHIRTHTGEKPYSCPIMGCQKCFKTSGDLQKHIRVHTGERPFVCPYEECGRSFTTSNIRTVHFRTHTGERPYTCNVETCGRTFASATNYKNHMRIHSGEKPYQCSAPGCEKRFTEYSSLYKHNLVHSQQKAYQCGVCDRTYRQASTLTMHKRTAHNIVETDDGTEIILGETVFTLADTDGGGTRLKALGSSVLGIRDGDRIVQVNQCDNNAVPQQFLVVTDSAQLTAFQECIQREPHAWSARERSDPARHPLGGLAT